MKETRRRFVLFSFYDRTNIAAFLEKQAREGWLLEKISAFGWKFRKIEPKDISFAVTFFPKASAFDPEPSEGQLSFREFCEHTGWKLAASNAQMQIFYNETEQPVPIETDAMIEIENIHASVKKSLLPNYVLLAIVGFLQMFLWVERLVSDPIDVFSSNASLFTGFCWIMTLLLVMAEVLGYYRWRKHAKRQAELDGSFLETNGHTNLQIVILTIVLLAFGALILSYSSRMASVAFLSIGLVLCVTAVVVLLTAVLKKCKVSARVNRTITIAATVVLSIAMSMGLIRVISGNVSTWRDERVADTYEFRGMSWNVYKDALPLTIEDLADVEYDGYSYERTGEESFLAAAYQGSQRPRMDALEYPDMEYTVVEVKASFLYDWCRDAMLEDFAHNYGEPNPKDSMWKQGVPVDADAWGAKEAYQLTLGGEPMERYLLCYEDVIVEIDFDWEVTAEQMRIVGEILGGN